MSCLPGRLGSGQRVVANPAGLPRWTPPPVPRASEAVEQAGASSSTPASAQLAPQNLFPRGVAKAGLPAVAAGKLVGPLVGGWLPAGSSWGSVWPLRSSPWGLSAWPPPSVLLQPSFWAAALRHLVPAGLCQRRRSSERPGPRERCREPSSDTDLDQFPRHFASPRRATAGCMRDPCAANP